MLRRNSRQSRSGYRFAQRCWRLQIDWLLMSMMRDIAAILLAKLIHTNKKKKYKNKKKNKKNI